MSLKFATFFGPTYGGVYRVEKMLADGLKPHGVDIRWLAVGKNASETIKSANIKDDFGGGEFIVPDEADGFKQAKAAYDYITQNKYDGVILGLLSSPHMTNLLRYLPENIFKVIVVHSITPGTYAYSKAVRDYVDLAVAVSPRIKDDLITRHGFGEENTVCIPNRIDISPYRDLVRSAPKEKLRIISMGRVEDSAKGVLWIPEILNKLNNKNVSLTVVGTGSDLPLLKDQCKGLGGMVNFIEEVKYAKVPEIFASHDVCLMPSRHEGFGLTLIEAMTAGCVPVASEISGVTDYIIKNGKTGFLFKIGGTRKAAEILDKLNAERNLLSEASKNAVADAKDRFSDQKSVKEYHREISRFFKNRVTHKEPLDLNNWSYPKELRRGLRSFLPSRLKNFLRVIIERTHKC